MLVKSNNSQKIFGCCKTENRKEALLLKFKWVEAIKNASLDKIEAEVGKAKTIQNYFKK